MPREHKKYADKNPTKGEGITASSAERKESLRLRPHEIVKQWFPSAFSHYTIDKKRELVDYLSEWLISKRNLARHESLYIITTEIEQRFMQEYISGRDFKNFLEYLSREKTTTPEDFMNYFLGEEHFARVKEEMQNQPQHYKEFTKITLEENLK